MVIYTRNGADKNERQNEMKKEYSNWKQIACCLALTLGYMALGEWWLCVAFVALAIGLTVDETKQRKKVQK